MVDDVRQTPLKWPHKPVVVALVIPAFTPVHVVLPERHEVGIVRQIGGKVKTLRPLRISASSALKLTLTQRAQRYAEGRRESQT